MFQNFVRRYLIIKNEVVEAARKTEETAEATRRAASTVKKAAETNGKTLLGFAIVATVVSIDYFRKNRNKRNKL
jgi:hypothetical protein